jgi:ABC-type branched-subunit amino acid transport system permease subunit
VSRAWAPAAVAVAAAAAFALAGQSAYWLGLLTLAGIYAVAAIGLTLLFGGAGQISLGHAGFLGIGGWMTAALTAERGWPFLASAALAIAVATGVGLLVGYGALRVEGHYLALATAAFGLLFAEIMSLRLPLGIYAVPPIDVFGVDIGSPRALTVTVWAVVVAVYAFTRSLGTSRFGRSLAALRDDPLAAASSGIDIARAKIVVFGISAALGGLSGALFAPYQASITDVAFGFFLSVNLLIMVVIGGLGSPGGAVAGALFLVIVPELGRDYERVRLLAYGVLLVVAIAAFPGGLAGLVSRRSRRTDDRTPSDARATPPPEQREAAS